MKDNNPFGLDIGTTTIKAVWLNQSKGGYSLNSALAYPAPAKGMLSESPLDQEEMINAIKRVIDLSKISTRYVNVALAENYVYTRVIEMPVLSDKELSSAIFWEAEQYIPVPLSDVTLDWKVLRRPTDPTAKMQVLLVGAPMSLIEKYQKILSLSGLFIASIETEILSAVRALVNTEPEKFPPSVIVQVGSVSTSLVVIKNGVIVFTYAIPIGGNAINRAISADFGFSLAQAEEYKKVYGVSEKVLGGKISKTTEAILSSIVNEVKKAIAFYQEKYREETQIRQVVLSGGTARLPGIDLFFANNCGIETIIANPWKVLLEQQITKDMLDSASSYTVAVGLAMRGYDE